MPRSDRAFRALARAQPDVVVGLISALAPDLLPEGAAPVPEDVTPTRIDALPPEMEADFAARIADQDLVHVECQGYHDAGFEPRTLWYHIGFALLYRGKRRVRTVAIWLTRPPKRHPRDRMSVHDITVKVTTVVLRDVRASTLLASASTACFAAGADPEGRSDDELCAAVARSLRARKASWAERHMAVVAALSAGRYKSMVKAMEDANLEPVIIEDLVKFGEDRGVRKGRKEGRQEGRQEGLEEGRREAAREALRRVLALRKLALTPEQARKIDTCADIEELARWHDQAVLARTTAAALR
jgi:hypothetical protein